jgi:hypothetical protein
VNVRFYMSIYIYIYIHTHIYICVCVCVCSHYNIHLSRVPFLSSIVQFGILGHTITESLYIENYDVSRSEIKYLPNLCNLHFAFYDEDATAFDCSCFAIHSRATRQNGFLVVSVKHFKINAMLTGHSAVSRLP